jgi:hypothetical protein
MEEKYVQYRYAFVLIVSFGSNFSFVSSDLSYLLPFPAFWSADEKGAWPEQQLQFVLKTIKTPQDCHVPVLKIKDPQFWYIVRPRH